jgi:hypothetical protein
MISANLIVFGNPRSSLARGLLLTQKRLNDPLLLQSQASQQTSDRTIRKSQSRFAQNSQPSQNYPRPRSHMHLFPCLRYPTHQLTTCDLSRAEVTDLP